MITVTFIKSIQDILIATAIVTAIATGSVTAIVPVLATEIAIAIVTVLATEIELV